MTPSQSKMRAWRGEEVGEWEGEAAAASGGLERVLRRGRRRRGEGDGGERLAEGRRGGGRGEDRRGEAGEEQGRRKEVEAIGGLSISQSIGLSESGSFLKGEARVAG